MTEIDYEAIARQLQAENEALRLMMLKERLKLDVPFSYRMQQVRDFVQRNYLVLVFGLILLSTLCSGLYTIWRNRGE